MERTIRPKAEIIDALRGEISEPVETTSNKPDQVGEKVSVRLVKNGAGMLGLEDAVDNKDWSGILNHVLLSARYATHFSKELKQRGMEANPERVLNGMIVSHPGRRQWDEAGWYPEAVADSIGKRSISNETLGMILIDGIVPQDAFELVVALGHNVEGFSVDPSIFDSLDFKIAIYVDHRTAQKYEPLNTRMGDFLLGNFYKREDITPELKEQVYGQMKSMIDKQKECRFSAVEPLSVEEADKIAEDLGASEGSSRLKRKELMRLILQDADTEAYLISAGIDPDNINDKTAPAPRWERYLRRLYINDAEEGIFEKVKESVQKDIDYDQFLANSERPNFSFLDKAFPEDSWWGSLVREVCKNQKGVPYKSQHEKPQGTQRAIEFFKYLDTLPLAKGEKVDELQKQS